MSAKLVFERRHFPARVAELGFAANLPADWTTHELPTEDLDFSNPIQFAPLAVVTAPHAALVVAIVARPAYDDGTLHDWAMYLLNHNQLEPRAIGVDATGGVPAVIGEATQESELGSMVVRFAFLEDGGRLINLTFSAPELLADAVREVWFELLRSFALETPRGSRFGSTDNQAQPEPPPAPATPTPEVEIPLRETTPNKPRAPSFALYALAKDEASLQEDHPTNADLRNRGVGLVPNVVATDDMEQFAIVAAGAIVAQFRVPFGWHVIDDGKRTLVFEPTGAIQIHLHLLAREGRDNDAILDDLEEQMRADYPHPEFLRLEDGKIHALGARNIADGNQPLEQYHMLYPARYKDLVLRARVTSTPERSTDACNLAELILHSLDFGCYPEREEPNIQSAADGAPAWWQRAQQLEAEDRLAEAEEVIQAGVPHLAYAASTAELYRLRMLRLKCAGDEAGARAAFQKSSKFIWHYASLATSGGEGAALSLERDQFRARLVSEYGSDPEA